MRKTVGLGIGAILLLVLVGIYALSFFNKGQTIALSDAVIKTVKVDVSSADVFIETTSTGHVEVETTETRSSKFIIHENPANTLTIREQTTGFFSWISFGNVPEVHIRLPKEQYDALQVEASSGDVALKNVAATSIHVKTSSGDIEGDDLTAKNYDFKASSGDMALDQLGKIAKEATFRASSGELSLDTLTTDTLFVERTSGDVSMDDIALGSGKSVVKTSSGDIDITPMFSDETTLSLESSSGDQTFDNQQNNAFNFTIQTSSGDIRVPSNYDLTTNTDNKAVGTTPTAAPNTVSITASSGDIKITD